MCVCECMYVSVLSARQWKTVSSPATRMKSFIAGSWPPALVSLPESAMNLTPNLTSLLLLIMLVLCSINHRLSFSVPLPLFRAVRFTKKHVRNRRPYRGLHRETATTVARTGTSGQAAFQLLLVAFTARQHRPTWAGWVLSPSLAPPNASGCPARSPSPRGFSTCFLCLLW